MTTTHEPRLDGFEQRLLHELRQIVGARAEHAALPTQPATKRRLPLPRWSRGVVAGIVLTGALASIGGLAAAGTLSGGTISPAAWSTGERVQPEEAPTQDQTADLAILRRPQVSADALTPSEAADLTTTPLAAYGPNPALARRAQGFSAGAAWLIPANGNNICFEVQYPAAGGGTTCSSDADFSAGREMTIGFSDNAPTLLGVAGVVPDGVSTVTLTPATGPAQTLSVHENVYMAEVPIGNFSVAFTGPNGPVTINGTSPLTTPTPSSTP
jgi:hypothetical protein